MVRIMTSNIWGDYFGNPVEARQDDAIRIYDTYAPDVIGFQEVTARWYASKLFGWLAESYHIIGPELWEGNNYVPLAVKKAYKLLQTGYFSFETSDKTKGVTWAVVESPDGKRFGVCNTHFWWKYGPEEYDALRMDNAQRFTRKMQEIRKQFGCPVFGFGDMNCVLQYPVFETVYAQNGIRPLITLTENRDLTCTIREYPEADSEGHYHGKKSEFDYTKSIDHIVALGEEYSVAQYRVAEDRFVLDATDHCPVYADVEL